MSNNTNPTILYLSWLPYGIQHLESFIRSYKKHEAGTEHQLVIAFNGTAVVEQGVIGTFLELLNQEGLSKLPCFYFDKGQDIEIYKQVSEALSSETILFLNSFSQFQAHGWLSSYLKHFDAGTGLISATASNQSYYSSVFQKHRMFWEASKGFQYNFRKYKLLVKAALHWRLLFKPFPNAHARSNAFMVRRAEFLAMNIGRIDSKFKAYIFENGRKSITNYYLGKNLKVLVVDKHSNAYSLNDAIHSNTFWIRDQGNLLVTDNQTSIYAAATAEEKQIMTTLAWGKT